MGPSESFTNFTWSILEYFVPYKFSKMVNIYTAVMVLYIFLKNDQYLVLILSCTPEIIVKIKLT